MSYRPIDCPVCRRRRILISGLCEKCYWHIDHNEYQRPEWQEPPPAEAAGRRVEELEQEPGIIRDSNAHPSIRL